MYGRPWPIGEAFLNPYVCMSIFSYLALMLLFLISHINQLCILNNFYSAVKYRHLLNYRLAGTVLLVYVFSFPK